MSDFEMPKEVWEFLQGYQKIMIDQELKELERRSLFVTKNQVVLLGDSITAQWPIYEMNKNLPVINRGVSGNTTRDILKRLDSTILVLEPSKLFLMIGINDIEEGLSNEEIIENINTIINTTKDKFPKCKIYLHNILHINKKLATPTFDMVRSRSNERVDELNLLINKIDNVTHLNLNPLLNDSEGNLNADYSIEGLHLNYYGYQVYLKYLEPFILE